MNKIERYEILNNVQENSLLSLSGRILYISGCRKKNHDTTLQI